MLFSGWHYILASSTCFKNSVIFDFVFLQSMLLLAPKLSEKTINNQLLKYFAKLQMDQEVQYGTSVCFLLNTSVVMEWYLLDCRNKSKISRLIIDHRKFPNNRRTCSPNLMIISYCAAMVGLTSWWRFLLSFFCVHSCRRVLVQYTE